MTSKQNSYSYSSETSTVNGVVQQHAEKVVVNKNGDKDTYQTSVKYDPETNQYVSRQVGNPNLVGDRNDRNHQVLE